MRNLIILSFILSLVGCGSNSNKNRSASAQKVRINGPTVDKVYGEISRQNQVNKNFAVVRSPSTTNQGKLNKSLNVHCSGRVWDKDANVDQKIDKNIKTEFLGSGVTRGITIFAGNDYTIQFNNWTDKVELDYAQGNLSVSTSASTIESGLIELYYSDRMNGETFNFKISCTY